MIFPLACEYGTARDIGCNVVASCVPEPNRYPLGNAKWVLTGPTSNCPTSSSPSCPDRNYQPTFGGCSSCGTVPIGAVCFYDDIECGCVFAGMECDPVWACMDPAPGCPRPRPNLGSPCDADAALECAYGQGQTDYGALSVGPGAVTVHCDGGTWQP